MNERGQILLPGLAWFLSLFCTFAILVAWGERTLHAERMGTAATAASLSAARAQAYLLNKRAMANLEAAPLVEVKPLSDYTVMEPYALKVLEGWYEGQKLNRYAENAMALMNGGLGYTTAVGSQVAKLNGAEKNNSLSRLDLRLKAKDLTAIVFVPTPPFVIKRKFQGLYYTRLWGYERRKAQPPHEVVWYVSNKFGKAISAAQVYLDVTEASRIQNGGFPREKGESFLGNLSIQSFYPQFNARLKPVPTPYRFLENRES